MGKGRCAGRRREKRPGLKPPDIQSRTAPVDPEYLAQFPSWEIIPELAPVRRWQQARGFLLGVLFLELNGVRFIASEEAATQAILELAAGKVNETGYADWLRANVKREPRTRRK